MKRFVKFCFSVILLALISFMGWNCYNDIANKQLNDDEKIKVACVGDSITFRYGFEDEPENNYPYVLQELLGSEYWVKNFGESGTCVQENVDDAYITHDKYTESLEFQADILLFMLGTNDSKAWNWKDEESFRQAYEKMLDSYMDVENPPEMYVVISPKAFYINGKDSGTAEFGIEPEHVDQIVKIQLEVAEERGYSVINMYEISKENPTWFEEDGIHPTLEGAKGLAEIVAETIARGVSFTSHANGDFE